MPADPSGSPGLLPISVGILHSCSGTMAISEMALIDAEKMAIAEINQAGGVLGRQIWPIVEDGASRPEIFAQKAQKLIQQDQVATLFGCWTSSSRKAVLPILEAHNALLWYPLQYEGLETSPHVFYTGSCPNQQVQPAVQWLLDNKGRRFFLLGSDYVFPRTANKIIKADLHRLNGELLQETYVPLGSVDFGEVIAQIQALQPDVIFSTLNGDSNLAFYQQYHAAGLTPAQMPIMAVSIAEGELQTIGEIAAGHYASWTYFQSLEHPRNQAFVQNFQRHYGATRVTSDPIEAAYLQGNWSPQQNCLIANGAKVCSIRVMKSPRPEPTLPEIDPEEQGARYWYERYCEQLAETEQLKRRVKELEKQFESLNEKLRKLSERTSETSSQPPSSDGPKKPNRDQQKPQRKRGPKYNHPGTTRNGFGWINHAELLDVQNCPICGGAVERQPQGTQRQQVAELVPELVEVWEYERPLYRCPACGWQGYQDLPLGCREGFSYGGRLSSVVGWLGYGGNLSWSKQRYVVESIFGIPMSQGSLAKLHQWFCEALQPAYEQWWTWIQQPGVRCVDETSYRLNGVNHWIWIATAPECCVLFFAPSRSSAEVKTLLGEDFAGILSSDCWSAYGPQSAVAKQKCWAHLQRELKALTTSRFPENREFAHRVFPIIHTARQAHRDYHQGQLSLAELQALRPIVEAELADVLEHPHQGRWAADSQALSNRFRRHWSDWFTFLTSPAVSPDNNEAERGLRPVVIHRKVTGGARSDWGAQLVAMMFSCLESMRRQGKNAVDHLFELIASSGCSPPALLPG
jgi:transposase